MNNNKINVKIVSTVLTKYLITIVPLVPLVIL